MSENIPGTYEGEDYARVCVGCLHFEGMERLSKRDNDWFARRTDFGTRRRSRKLEIESKNVQLIMSV